MYASLSGLVARKHDVSILHILDPAEESFDFDMPATFASMEDSRRLFVHPRSVRATYIAQMQQFLADTRRKMAGARVRYQRVSTADAPSDVLASYLSPRAAG